MAYVKRTDVHIGCKIFVSRAVLNSKDKRRKKRAFDILTMINRGVPEFRKLLELPQDLVFRVAPIKGVTNGRYNCGGQLVELNCDVDGEEALEVLAHELIHAHQYHTGQLKQYYNSKNGWTHTWHGTVNNIKGSTYNAYRSLPWEKEAFERQSNLALKVKKRLEKKYG